MGNKVIGGIRGFFSALTVAIVNREIVEILFFRSTFAFIVGLFVNVLVHDAGRILAFTFVRPVALFAELKEFDVFKNKSGNGAVIFSLLALLAFPFTEVALAVFLAARE